MTAKKFAKKRVLPVESVFCAYYLVVRWAPLASNVATQNDSYATISPKNRRFDGKRETKSTSALYISLPLLHDYDVKMPYFTICRGREHKTTTFLALSEFDTVL